MPSSADVPRHADDAVPVQQPAPWLPDEGEPPAADMRRVIRERAREAAVANNRTLDYAASEEEARRRFAACRTWDALPHVDPALLNAADIADYARTTAMVYPFRPDDLKPASLMIRLHGEYRFYDADNNLRSGHVLPWDDPSWSKVHNPSSVLTVPGNSIVFVTIEPLFQVPDYLALRYNLKIDHVYKGLLLGTGPLVDPGFVGRLSIPLHNLTVEDYTFRAGEGLIWVEFTKLSRDPLFDPRAKPSEKRLGRYTFFQPSKNARERTIEDYIREGAGERRPRSSIPETLLEARRTAQQAVTTVESGVADAEQTARGAVESAGRAEAGLRRAISRVSIFAVIGVILAAVGVLLPTYNLVRDSNDQYQQLLPRLLEQQAEIDRLRLQLVQLEAELATPDAPVAPPPGPPPADPP